MVKIKECRKFMKVCSKCGQLKLMIHFYKNKTCRDGRRNDCKQCNVEGAKKRHKCICLQCNKDFTTQDKNQKFCSQKCMGMYYKERIKVNCGYCGKEFEIVPSRAKDKNNIFCSRECMGKWMSENNTGENNPNYNSIKILCDCCGKEFERYESAIREHNFCSQKCMGKWMSENLTGENSHGWQGGKIKIKCDYCGEEISLNSYRIENYEHHFCSRECKDKWQGENIKGENHPNYNSNITDEERERNRKIPQYRQWREEVFKRDNYTCQITGDNRGGNLVAHHLNSFNYDKEHRYDVDNGITITEEVHKLFHKLYGYGNNTKEQFDEFKIRYYNGEFREVS